MMMRNITLVMQVCRVSYSWFVSLFAGYTTQHLKNLNHHKIPPWNYTREKKTEEHRFKME